MGLSRAFAILEVFMQAFPIPRIICKIYKPEPHNFPLLF